jgi:hypothetical protein
MNDNTTQIILGGFLLTAATIMTLGFMYFTQPRTSGDMNKDGELTIVDLSILAEVIRNGQR